MDFIVSNWLAWVTALGGWVIGVVSDLGKEHWRRQRDIKEAHAKTIQKEILEPIYEYLKAFYLPVSRLMESPITVSPENITKNPSNITEDAYAGTRFVVCPRVAEKPTGKLLQSDYWHESEGFKRYYADAKDNHYAELLTRWEAFREKFEGMQEKSLGYTANLVSQLNADLKMEPFSPMGLPKTPWASYEKIALIIFKRHLGIGAEGIRFDESWGVSLRTSMSQEEVLKCVSTPDAKKALEIINNIPHKHEAVDEIKLLSKRLEQEADKLLQDFRFEISKTPKAVGCKLI